jgi:hypothetical protein
MMVEVGVAGWKIPDDLNATFIQVEQKRRAEEEAARKAAAATQPAATQPASK